MGPEQAGFLQALAESHDGWSLPWFTDEQLDQFYGEHGLTPNDLARMRRHVTSQPMATYREALHLPGPTVARTYVRCTRTPMPPAAGADSSGWNWRELDAGHWPMITAPDQTARLLAELAA